MQWIKLAHLQATVARIKEKFVEKEMGKGLSTNDLTSTLKTNYDAAHTHSQAAHAPSGAEANILEGVKINGTTQTINGKTVDISVPTDVNQLSNGANYQSATNVASLIAAALAAYNTSTEVATAIANAVASAGHLKREIVSALPAAASADANTIYMKLKGAGSDDNMYDEYMIINSKWEKIGDTEVDLTGYIKESDIEEITEAEIDAMFQ